MAHSRRGRRGLLNRGRSRSRALDPELAARTDGTAARTGDLERLPLRDRRGDRGPDVADWAEVFYVGKVAANATEMTCTTLPAKWLRSGGTIRFLLTSAPYDERLDYIASTAAGNQYLDTEVKPTTNTVFAMRITKKVSDHAAWGAVGDNAGPAMSAFAHSSNSGVPWSFFNCSGN